MITSTRASASQKAFKKIPSWAGKQKTYIRQTTEEFAAHIETGDWLPVAQRTIHHLKRNLGGYTEHYFIVESAIRKIQRFIPEFDKKALEDAKQGLDAILEVTDEPHSPEVVHTLLKTVEKSVELLLSIYAELIQHQDDLLQNQSVKANILDIVAKDIGLKAARQVGKRSMKPIDPAIKELVKRLTYLKVTMGDAFPKYEGTPAGNARKTSAHPNEWVKKRYAQLLSAEELSVALSTKVHWYKVDTRLYKALAQREIREKTAQPA